ncbi:MAG: ATP-binding protein [Gemmatimonadota bacterium]|nr:ATP-binding protein [Gemmatimonadota bacterium]
MLLTSRELSLILDSMSGHLLYHDLEMRILWVNKAAAESAGMKPEDLVGRYCYEIWPNGDSICRDCPVREAGQTGEPRKREMQTPDGRIWLVRGYPVKDENGKVEGVIEMTEEVTEIRHAEQAFRLASLGVMAGGITHEINQPLSVIKATADIVNIWNEKNQGVLPEYLTESLKKISGSVGRIDRIIRQMRSYVSAPEKAATEKVDLNDMVQEAMMLLNRQLVSHGIELEVNLCNKGLPVMGNRINLGQILINLVVNAMQVLDTVKRERKYVRITSYEEGGCGFLEVRDNGTGIPPAVRDRLFKPLVSTKKDGQGTGLGLALVKQFVEGMGGAVQAGNCEEDNGCGGAVFTMKFPLYSSKSAFTI